MAPRKKVADSVAESEEVKEIISEPIIEIGEPDLPELTITDSDPVDVSVPEHQNNVSNHTPKSFARSFVQVLSLGSMQATKQTGLDMDMSEDEAVEMEQATQDFMESIGGVDLPPWAAFLMATGTFVGGRVAMYMMAKENVIDGDQND